MYSRPEDTADKMIRVECLIVNVPQLSADTLLEYLQDSSFSSRLQNNLQLGPVQLNISSKPVVYILHVYIILSLGNGFCNNEVIDTPDRRGEYLWSETQVGSAIQRSCFYNNASTGSRLCLSHLRWENANLKNCITSDTLELQLLAKSIVVC